MRWEQTWTPQWDTLHLCSVGPQVVPMRVNSYSITKSHLSRRSRPHPPDPDAEEANMNLPTPSRYSMPCGCAAPYNLPLHLLAYSTPAVIAVSLNEEVHSQETMTLSIIIRTLSSVRKDTSRKTSDLAGQACNYQELLTTFVLPNSR